jgi:hypothetical protein
VQSRLAWVGVAGGDGRGVEALGLVRQSRYVEFWISQVN